MEKFPEKLQQKLAARHREDAFRELHTKKNLVDFSSNDYLGFARSEKIFEETTAILNAKNLRQNGATGSRLLSGNSGFYEETERKIAAFHQVESTLIFNSGYDANMGFFSCVPQRGDLVFYDEFIHASIRDGIRTGLAKSFKFKHNSLEGLQKQIAKKPFHPNTEIYIVTESVFSMDGDSPDLKAFADFCSKNNFHLIVDEAHAIGIFGENGKGLVQDFGLENRVFARIVTFGKALGCHGAAVLGSGILKNHLINFCRSFIYTTALPPHSVATIRAVYSELQNQPNSIKNLRENISFFKNELKKNALEHFFVPSNSAIQCCKIPGNKKVKEVSEMLQKKGFDVRPILSPTVPKGQERLRFCIHSYNSKEEISEVLRMLGTFVLQ